MKKRIRLQGMLMFLSIITILFLSKFIFPYWKHKLPDDFTDALGVILVLSGFFIRIVARGYKADGSINGGKLLREGIYGIIRNPMYAGTFLIGLGIVLVLFVWWAFLIFAAVFISIYYRQVRKEEKVLSSHFGPEYGGYCKTTPRYFPRISRIFSSDPRYRIFFPAALDKKRIAFLNFCYRSGNYH